MTNQENLVNEVAWLLEQKKQDYQIRMYLADKGVDPDDFEGIISEAMNKQVPKKGKNRRVIWIICTVFTFALFYFLIPNSVYNSFPFLISLIGSTLFSFFLIQSIVDYGSWKEFNGKGQGQRDWRYKFTYFIAIPWLTMFFVFLVHFSVEESEELKEYGIKTNGVIVEGYSMESRRGGIYEIKVRFKTEEGDSVTATESVGEDEFYEVYKGQEVKLIYSSKNPKIIELLISNKAVKSYTDSEEREITLNDLIALQDIEDAKIGEFLNRIYYGWDFDDTDSAWVNVRSNSVIRLTSDLDIKYVAAGSLAFEFSEMLENTGFTAVERNEDNTILFLSDTHIAAVKTVTDTDQLCTIVQINKRNKL